MSLFFLLPGSEHEVGREFFICEDAAFVTPVCPRLVFGNAHLAHLVKYCIQPLPTGRRLSSASIKFLWLRQHPRSHRYISSSRQRFIDPPELLFTALYSFIVRLYIFFRWSRSVTTTVNKSQRRGAFACRLF